MPTRLRKLSEHWCASMRSEPMRALAAFCRFSWEDPDRLQR
jgi:hypothetical protein